MKIILKLAKSSNALLTTRNTITSLFLYIGALVGSTFGMLEIFGVVMGVVEGFFDHLEHRKIRKVYAQEVIGIRNNLISLFDFDLPKIFLFQKGFTDGQSDDMKA